MLAAWLLLLLLRFQHLSLLRVVLLLLVRLQYGVSRVLVTASEMLTAYQLLMQQAEYSVQMGTSRCISARLFDSLLSLTLTDL